MKKNIFAIAFIAITLCMASCQREEIIPGISGNGENPANTPRVAVTSDLIGTDWTANLALEDLLQAMTGMNLSDYGCEFPEGFDANMTFHINFDSEYAHITFGDNITVINVAELAKRARKQGDAAQGNVENATMSYIIPRRNCCISVIRTYNRNGAHRILWALFFIQQLLIANH